MHVIEKVINAIKTFIENNPSHIPAYISDNARYEKAPVPNEKKAGNNKNTIVNKAAIIWFSVKLEIITPTDAYAATKSIKHPIVIKSLELIAPNFANNKQ